MSGLRSGLSLHPPPENPRIRCCPSSLYTSRLKFPSGLALGIAMSGFPEFEQFYIAGFPGEHSSFLKSAAYVHLIRLCSVDDRDISRREIMFQLRGDEH
jgi:hypothetical protein